MSTEKHTSVEIDKRRKRIQRLKKIILIFAVVLLFLSVFLNLFLVVKVFHLQSQIDRIYSTTVMYTI